MAVGGDSSETDAVGEVSPRRRGIGLCLSGGGFRATLFHAGVIQRLFELGVARRADFETVASVSGGSITAAQWAVAEAEAQLAEKEASSWSVDPGFRRGDGNASVDF